MNATNNFRQDLNDAARSYDQAKHPFVDKWAAGELSRAALAGQITETWHWINRLIPEALLNIASRAPTEVIDMEMENYQEEMDPANPHPELIVRFAEACGVSRNALLEGRGLPTTEAWTDWELRVSREQPWIAAMAAVHVGSEAQEPRVISRVLPALRKSYKFSEHELEFFWVHGEADIEHGGRATDMLLKYCDTAEKRDMALHWVKESCRMKYLFWNGIHLHYNVGFTLA
jgi:pyrroloquinoline-quinone synthase